MLGTTSVAPAAVVSIQPAVGSRRRRIWELGTHAHCPVVGVCVPMRALRRLVDKVLGGEAIADDYELHCGVIAQCKRRTPVGEAMQRELDRRYAIAVRQAAMAKTTEALAAWWQESLSRQDVAGALWATLTHARCAPDLEQRVLADVHMLQHQVGMAARVDLDRFEALLDENAVLAKELADAQQRSARHAAEHARRTEQQEAQLVRLRAELIGRDSIIAALREDASADRLHQPRCLLARQGSLQAHRQALRVRREPEPQQPAARAAQLDRCDRHSDRRGQQGMRVRSMSRPLSLPLSPSTDHGKLPPAARRCVVIGVLAAHVAAAWALLQVEAVRQAVREVAPVMVDLIAAPAPPAPPPPPKVVKSPLSPKPVIARAPAPSPSPAEFAAPPQPEEPPPSVAGSPAAPATPPAPGAPPAPPKTIPATAVQYLEAPAPIYPSMSRRLSEAGRVLVRVEIDTDGRARQVQLLRSSSYSRLDESALAAVRAARFKPHTENGVPLIVWTTVPIVFELEN